MSEYSKPIIDKTTEERYALSLGNDGGIVALLDSTTSTNSVARPICNFPVFPNMAPINTWFGVSGLSSSLSPASVNTRAVPTCEETKSTAMDSDDESDTLAIPGLSGRNRNSVEQTVVPSEIEKAVKFLKDYIKEQQKLSDYNDCSIISNIKTVSYEIEMLNEALTKFSKEVECNQNLVNLALEETYNLQELGKEAVNAKNAPPNPWETTNYLRMLVENYERDLTNMTQKIISAEAIVNSPIAPRITSPAEIMNGIQQGNKILVSLASRGFELNERVNKQKAMFLQLREKILGDKTDIFEQLNYTEQ